MEKIIMSLFSGIIALVQFIFYSQCSQDYDGYRRGICRTSRWAASCCPKIGK